MTGITKPLARWKNLFGAIIMIEFYGAGLGSDSEQVRVKPPLAPVL